MSIAAEGGERARTFASRAWVIWSALAAEAVTARWESGRSVSEMHVRRAEVGAGEFRGFGGFLLLEATVHMPQRGLKPHEHLLGEVHDGEWGDKRANNRSGERKLTFPGRIVLPKLAQHLLPLCEPLRLGIRTLSSRRSLPGARSSRLDRRRRILEPGLSNTSRVDSALCEARVRVREERETAGVIECVGPSLAFGRRCGRCVRASGSHSETGWARLRLSLA